MDKQTGDAGDTVLRETGEKKRMSGDSCTGVIADVTPFFRDTRCRTSCDASGSARSTCSEMPVGGADAGSAAANVNLIQPCQKRKAFNTMTRIRAFIVTPDMKTDAR
ncbi:MAG: hypothetical protein M3O74_11375 [Pseudomonadota bacterium]|nr:hypothetical protein [Pseudomonadota bacterium]